MNKKVEQGNNWVNVVKNTLEKMNKPIDFS